MHSSITTLSVRFATPLSRIANKSIARCCFVADACAAPSKPIHMNIKRASSSVLVLGVLVT